MSSSVVYFLGVIINGAIPEISAASAQALGITLPNFDVIEPFDLQSLEETLAETDQVLTSYALENYGAAGAAYVDLFLYGQVAQIMYLPDIDNPFMDSVMAMIESSGAISGIPAELYVPIVEGVQNNVAFDANADGIEQMVEAIKEGIQAETLSLNQSSGENTAVSDQWLLTLLAEDLAIAGLAQGLSLSDSLINDSYESATGLSNELNITIPDLFESVPYGETQAGNMYVFDVQAILIVYAEENMGPEEASIVELIMSAKIAQTWYDQEDRDTTQLILNTLTRASFTSGLPAEIYQPLIDSLEDNLSWETVNNNINQMVFDIQQYFEEGPIDVQVTIPDHKRLLWEMGRQVAIAGIGQGFDLSQDIIDDSIVVVNEYAVLLNIELPNINDAVPKGDSLKAFSYIFDVQSIIGTYARETYGEEEEGLVAIGVQSVLINTLYEPNNDSLIGIMERRLMDGIVLTNIPEIVFSPILQGLENNIPAEEMRQHITELNAFLDGYIEGNP